MYPGTAPNELCYFRPRVSGPTPPGWPQSQTCRQGRPLWHKWLLTLRGISFTHDFFKGFL